MYLIDSYPFLFVSLIKIWIMRILSLMMALFCYAIQSNAQEEFLCDSIGVSSPLNFVTTFTPSSVDVGAQICVDFAVQNFENVLGTTNTISFDPNQLVWVSSTSTDNGISSVSFNENSVANGVLSFLWTDQNVVGVSLPDNTSLFEVCFVIVGEPGETVELYFNNALVPAFPESGVVYQVSPIIACEDKYLELNGGNSASIQINCPSPTVTNINACEGGASNGVISFQICGGQAPYVVVLANDMTGTSQTEMVNENNIDVLFEGLAPGNYTANINDANGVGFSESIIVKNSGPLTFETETVNPSCFYTRNGSITISNFSGGTPPYSATGSNGLFLNGELESTFGNLSTGTYHVTISDNAGCSMVDSFVLDTPAFEFDLDVSAATCVNTGDGFLSLSVSGGTPFANDQYIINGILQNDFETNDPTGDINFNLENQIYSIVVEDANGCRDGLDVVIPYILAPGTPCDDMDPNTVNDVYQIDCTCEGTEPLELSFLGNPVGYLPPALTVEISDCTEGFTFPNGQFTNLETNTIYPFPLEDGVHFMGEDATFQSSHLPTDTFLEGQTIVSYSITDAFDEVLTHFFAINVVCTGCSTLQTYESNCSAVPNSAFFDCSVEALLQGYSGCTPLSNGSIQQDQPNPLCNDEGEPNKMSWFAFVAGSEDLIINIAAFNCQAGAGGAMGLEIGVYDECLGGCIAGDTNCDSTTPDALTLNNLNVGSTYYLFIDGCQGSQCEYTITVSNFENFEIATPEEIVFGSPDSGCQVLNNRFCSDCEINIGVVFNGNETYNSDLDADFVWTVNPPIDGFNSFTYNLSENGFVFPILNNVDPGSYGICLFEINTDCSSWSSVICSEIIVEDCDLIDNDGDGVSASTDCNDDDPEVFPGNTEVCDGKDNNCDGVIDEGLVFTYYLDTDGDGFGSAANSTESCDPLNGFVENGDDCDDGNAQSYPGAPEICDGEDNNCDGIIDEGFSAPSDEIIIDCESGEDFINFSWNDVTNADFYEVVSPSGTQEVMTANFILDNISAGAYEITVQAFSNDGCSGQVYSLQCSTSSIDNDGDGFTASDDCDDNDPFTFPGAEELCDGKDNNCDGVIDEGLTFLVFYSDNDGDGYGAEGSGIEDCLQPPDTVTEGGDCDDTDENIYPGAPEILSNGIDEDCDGIDNTVSVNELNGKQFIVYPNPTTSILNVEGTNFSKAIIINRLGREIKASQESTIDIGDLEEGIYFIKFLDEANLTIGLTKIIKQQ